MSEQADKRDEIERKFSAARRYADGLGRALTYLGEEASRAYLDGHTDQMTLKRVYDHVRELTLVAEERAEGLRKELIKPESDHE